MKFTWNRHGGYEVSSRGDKRFSAFNALLPDGRSIEHHYQGDVKGYDPGGTDWRLGKGKPPLNSMDPDTQYQAYKGLWREWAQGHLPEMRDLYRRASAAGGVLSDRFASSPVNQARALAEILNELVERGR